MLNTFHKPQLLNLWLVSNFSRRHFFKNCMKGIFEGLCLLFFCINPQFSALFAQSVESESEKDICDTSFVKSYYKDICITTDAFAYNAVFNITSLRKEEAVVYQSNLPIGAGLSFDYKWFTIGFSKNVTYLNLHDKLSAKGITNYKAFQFGVTSSKIIARLHLHTVRGFYLIGAGGEWATDSQLFESYERRGDVRMSTYFGNFSYVFNHRKYSHLATLWQLEQQRKSAGSPLFTMSFNRYKISGDSSIVPMPAVESLEQTLLNRDAFNVNFAVGYTHTFVLKECIFFNTGMNLGFGTQIKFAENNLGTRLKSEPAPSVSYDFSFTTGYNGEKFFGGISAYVYSFVDELVSGAPHNYTFGKARVFFGYRVKNKKS